MTERQRALEQELDQARRAEARAQNEAREARREVDDVKGAAEELQRRLVAVEKDVQEREVLAQLPSPPPPRTKWTRRVPHPVLIGHAASLALY